MAWLDFAWLWPGLALLGYGVAWLWLWLALLGLAKVAPLAWLWRLLAYTSVGYGGAACLD